MAMIRAGKLRHKLTLQAATESADAVGGTTETWAAVATIWGDIRPLKAEELVNADKLTQTATHNIRIRYYSGLTPSHRLVYDTTRTFQIIEVISVRERGHMMDLRCKELV